MLMEMNVKNRMIFFFFVSFPSEKKEMSGNHRELFPH